MSPLTFLGLLATGTTVAVYVDATVRRRRRRAVRRLAAEWQMHYMPADSLRVTPKIARHFPIPGAANLQLRDLIYGIERNHYRYVFTAEYTAGVVRTKTRLLRVGTFIEPRSRIARLTAEEAEVILAPQEGTLEEQYLALAPKAMREEPAPRAE